MLVKPRIVLIQFSGAHRKLIKSNNTTKNNEI